MIKMMLVGISWIKTLIFFVLFNPLNELLDGWFNPIIMLRMGPPIYKLVYNLITSSKYSSIVINIHKYHTLLLL